MSSMPEFKDRVWDTTQTTGTGAYVLDESTPAGYQDFYDAFATAASPKVHYLVTDGTDWEVGEGTFDYTASPDQLSRDTIFASSNSGNAVNWGAGSKDVTLVLSARVLQLLQNIAFNAAPSVKASAAGLRSIALGASASAYSNETIAIGDSAAAGQDGAVEYYAIAIGTDSRAYESDSIAIGRDAAAGVSGATASPNAVAIGYLASAAGSASVALGAYSDAFDTGSLALGYGCQSYDGQCVAIGYNAEAGASAGTTHSNVAIGNAAKSGHSSTAGSPSESDCIAIGSGADSREDSCIAIGHDSIAGGGASDGHHGAVAIGQNANAQANQVCVVGPYAYGYGVQGVALGTSSDARETKCISIGHGSQAGLTNGGTTESDAVAVGSDATAYETETVAIGHSAQAGSTSGSTRPFAIAVGADSMANADSAISVGNFANVVGTYGIAIGARSNADEQNGIAIGYYAHADSQGSIRIGYEGQVGYSIGSKNYGIGIGYDVFNYSLDAIAIGARAYVGNTSGTVGEKAIAIGPDADVTHDFAVGIGPAATSKRPSEHCYSIDRSTTNNIHRAGTIGLAITTSDATPTKLKVGLNGTDYVPLMTSGVMAFSALVVGFGTSSSCGYRVDGVIENYSTPSLIGSSVTVLGEENAATDCAAGVDTTNNGLYIEVTGISGAMEWTAHITFAEVDS